jgi:uncharacterized protein
MKKTTLILIAVLVVSSIAGLIFWNKKPSIKRPQEPTKPYSYYSEEVTFRNTEANITLAGTLTLPAKEGNYPAAILISGSGPQNRDEELAGHKPFLVISDFLTKNGIAVLRFDDRGFGLSSGDFKSATTLDFATDVESAIAYLKTRKEIHKAKIGLVGHSEGGLVAPMVAAKSKDVNFIVLLAGPGMKGDKGLILQQELIQRAMGIPEASIQQSKKVNEEVSAIILNSTNTQRLKADLTQYTKENFEHMPTYLKPANLTKELFIVAQINRISTPGFQYLVKYDPAPALAKVTCPVLALNGEKDLQVPPKEHLTAIGKALKQGGNPNVTIKELPNLNHLFQECQTGSPTEYAAIEQTFSPMALAEISNWILKQVN